MGGGRVVMVCCGYECDAASDLEALVMGEVIGWKEPRAGDVTVCFNCGSVLVFDGAGGVRWPRRVEVEALSGQERWLLRRAQRYVRDRGMIPREERRVRGN